MDQRLARIARNEGLYRSVNEAIEQVSEDLEDRSWAPNGGEIEFHCECGGEDCDARVTMTTEEYERVHRERDRFVVARGHHTPAIENVVEEGDRYCVVDKLPEAERQLDDPRSSPEI
jgi:hypothetical protein